MLSRDWSVLIIVEVKSFYFLLERHLASKIVLS